MLELIQKIFIGHVHHWETIEEYEKRRNDIVIGQRYICKCKHCGVIKNFDM